VWLRSRQKNRIEEALDELISKTKRDIVDWRELSTRELALLYSKLHAEMREIQVPSVVRLWFRKHNPFAASFTREYARRIWRRWYRYVWNPLTWADVWMFEWVNGYRFLVHLVSVGAEPKPTRY